MKVYLETERLILRQFTPEDVDDLLELDRDPEVRRYLDMPEPDTDAPLQRVFNLMTRIQALIALGDKSSADDLLRHAYAIVEAYEFPHLKPHLDWLAELF